VVLSKALQDQKRRELPAMLMLYHPTPTPQESPSIVACKEESEVKKRYIVVRLIQNDERIR
jgi:hypothetical protein